MQQGAHRPGSCRVPGSRRPGPRSSRARAASWLLRRAPSPALPTLLEPQRATALWPGCCREDPWRCPSMPSHSSDPVEIRHEAQDMGGSPWKEFNHVLLKQVIGSLPHDADKKGEAELVDAAAAALAGIRPKDEVEGMLAAQMVAA